jgi:lantibiotic leader peptide-processing serine protease
MFSGNHRIVNVLMALAVILLLMTPAVPAAQASAPAAPLAATGKVTNRLLIRATSAADFPALRKDVQKAGGRVVLDRPDLNLMVVSTPITPTMSAGVTQVRTALAEGGHVAQVAQDGIRSLYPNAATQEEILGKHATTKPQFTRNPIKLNSQATLNAPVPYDPFFQLPGLMWNVERLQAFKAWQNTNGYGTSDVLVGVADTGLDYTHSQLGPQVVDVIDFTTTEYPPICSYYFGYPTDAELSAAYGGPADTDWNGHGSWIGGNIAAALDGQGMSGIASGVSLVALKISQSCGSAYDSEILNSFLWAADTGLDVVNISFGGYLDRSDAAQDLTYKIYEQVVAYARARGTVIVAAAGNEHVRLGAGGEVISHGILDVPPGGTDYFGLWETPGGIPGVIMVSSTTNVVNPPSATCPDPTVEPDATGAYAWCKPTSDAHQPYGVGLQNQLAYYSNYGPRIDFAAPGGGRKFNLPAVDRGGSPGWPYTGTASVFGGSSVSDGYNAWETFSITSNWATEIDCFIYHNTMTNTDDCYANIQGTSMAAPHVAAVFAITASAVPSMRYNPDALEKYLKTHTQHISGNTTPPMSATDLSLTDRTGAACPLGFCHLGGAAISDADAYGYGLIDAFASFWPRIFTPVVAK